MKHRMGQEFGLPQHIQPKAKRPPMRRRNRDPKRPQHPVQHQFIRSLIQ